ncbi:DUF305 domain-containing protein [Alteromonas sediminis]|uniref:DUF305 domain-containing protein n=1 Tax=Alteromonas sediminis TaxID=2259342 RepID=A0A3N5XZD4_9ALTE|nr:DUF305 domain-containing protein [Alteromonas sediminis]RPJ66637.1 DUF305 domain-containing protein [Alteromonas sediminis]
MSVKFSVKPLYLGVCAALSLGLSPVANAQEVPIIQPGAPGQESKKLDKDQAIKVADTSFTKADVAFMQHMIPHHAQAVEMGNLVADRTNNKKILTIAGRIEQSQADEIKFMQDWLTQRGQETESAHFKHMDPTSMGMATPEQMAELADAEGTEFDRLFLTLMIPHHQGAVDMVDDLLDTAGAAYDPVLYNFVKDIVADQTAEIIQMNNMLANLSSDPRSNLSPGFRNAGEAIQNLTLVSTLPKPAGFFDPENPANIPPVMPKKASKDDESEESEVTRDREEDAGDAKTQYSDRWPLLSFWNTDMAFSEDILVAGNYHGFNIYQLNDAGLPNLMSSIVCPGGQGDVSIVGDLLIMSVEQNRGRIDCGLEGVDGDISDERFRGLRIFDISDITRPKQVGLVQTCRGSHTHSVVKADDETILVYNSGTSFVRDNEELAGCIGEVAGDERTALFRIDVVEIPVKDPSKARITSSPAVFADDEGRVAGLWLGGDHGEGTQDTRPTDECHDITVFPSANIAAGACSGNGIVFDISDPYNPKRIDAVTDPGFAYWHSATFSNDGTKVVFTDEWGGGTQPRCRPSDPQEWGANALYSIVDGKLEFESYYKIPAPQSELENCVAHNGSVVPVPGRDIFAQAWYQGGLSLMDFTTASEPQEIAYFDRGPIHDEEVVIGGYWSTYWYNGKIYGTAIIRGLDVFELTPSEFLSENEIAAAKLADMGNTFNPQQQFPVTWPDVPVVALAYLDQLDRHSQIDQKVSGALRETLSRAQQVLDAGMQDKSVATLLQQKSDMVKQLASKTPSSNRLSNLASTLTGIAKQL